VISATGVAKFGNIEELSDEDYMLGLTNKLMGQVNLVRVGLNHVNDNGSFTLTTGISRKPTPGSSAVSMANAAVEGFVRAAALELQRGIRVNVVSPGSVKETLEAKGKDSTHGIPAAMVALSYQECVQGNLNGEVLDAINSRDYA
jgi:NAD(P)-dependent dehydrogenase (short-subunit alcohol dehydrogenase family)